ncbi:phage tail tape measure protein [Sulfurimonas sp.]|uniref:phage tail tape measure protein n=1 Tax=Sulfurimonas sp. TaxID=2022749 RepID=UPI0025D48D19|nr:phage tail tape measure protein [Sulfurimonas sp.]
MEKLALSVVIGGAIASSFNSSIKSSSKSISQIGSEIKKMDKTKINIKRFKELQKNTQGNRKEFVKLGRSLKDVGVDLNNISKYTKKANSELLKLKKNAIIKGHIQIEKNNLMAEKDSLLATVGSGMAIGGVINLRSEVMQAQGELQSLKIGDVGIGKITAEAKAFSNEFAGTTTPEFLKASYDIKSGISSLSDEAIGKYTRMAAITAGATKSTTTQMTSFFATGYGIYSKQFEEFGAKTIKGWDKLSQEEKDIKFGETFSAGIGSAVQMFKTDGTKMQSAIETLGAQATTSNVPLSEQIAILGQMQKSFSSGSEAATAYKGFLTGAVGAQKDLGLEFLDSNNQLKSAPLILEELRSKYGETLDDMEKQELKKAFGTEEGMKFITAYYGEVDELRNNINAMDKSMRNGTKTVDDMMKATQKGKGFQLLGNQLANLGATIGKVLYPAISTLGTIVGALAVGLDTLITEFPLLSSVIGYAVVGTFTIIAVMKTAKIVSFAMRVANLSLRGSFLGNIVMLKSLRLHYARFNVMSTLATAKQWLFNTALNANPIGLIITGVAALIGLGVVLYKNFEPFKNLIDSILDGVGSVVKSVGSFFGLGNDEDEEKKTTNNTKFKMGDTAKKVATATAVSSQLVAAQPNLNYTPLSTPKQAIVKEVSQSITINFGDIKLDVKDGKIPQDLQAQIEASVKKAIAKTKSNRGLSDENI